MRKGRDGIIHIGLNNGSLREVEELRRSGNVVQSIQDSKFPDKILVAGKWLDLDSAEGQQAFVRSLNLQPAPAAALLRSLSVGRLDTRDELSKLISLFSKIERGVLGVGRLVISGHHVRGNTFWGDENGMIELEDFRAIAKVFPRAAAAIEDLHISACYSAAEIKAWPTVFPAVATIWAYAGSAPGSSSGACAHLRAWDRATRGDSRWIDRLKVKDTRKGGNVAVWSRTHGYQTATVEPLSVIKGRIAAFEPDYREYFLGNRVVENTDQGPLRDFYNDLHAAVQHADTSDSERRGFEGRLDTTIRLIFFDRVVKAKFAAHYRSQIAAGHASAGLAVPDFASLSRKQALQQIEVFERKVGASRDAAILTLKTILVDGLKGLSGKYIPVGWV